LFFAASINLWTTALGVGRGAYDLDRTKGMEAFGGSVVARQLLAQNGFVVADPAFKQIFEPYIVSPTVEKPSETNPMGTSLPSFITVDSAWHTYHVLLEEGVRQLEEIQAQRLARFSRLLLGAEKGRAEKGEPDASDFEWFASIGLAFQDEHYRQSLAPEEKRVVDALRTGTVPVKAPIGFDLSPLQFHPQSFYNRSPELSDYFAARQWYACVVFRLTNPRETKLAITLAKLINNDQELLTLWKQLSDPFDTFLASAEDGTVPIYADAAKAVLGATPRDPAAADSHIAEIQKRLNTQLPWPRVNDQLLSPGEYADFSRVIRGFRLLPPRRLPCAVCFHNTTDPKIQGRMYPSGLDFLAASPVLRSPAAVRAVKDEFGKSVSEAILKADCGPMPDSLHGEAMKLLAKLQEPLPEQVAPALRTEAWADLQLWTQLGGWAEQRHTWALHTKLSVEYMGSLFPPVGMVAPYPDFFAGLAKLSRSTAEAFVKAGVEQHFEIKDVASDLLKRIGQLRKLSTTEDEKEIEQNSGGLEQLNQFLNREYVKRQPPRANAEAVSTFNKFEDDLADLARRCSATGKATEAETETLRSYFECREDIARLLSDFAKVCDRLAELAQKSLTGTTPTEEDAKWIRDYGVTLAGFHFYYGNSYEVPRDDFPLVTRVFDNPLTGSVLYAGLARPQALYVIIPNGDSLQLYRGAVMTYREFIRREYQPLDDQSWRDLVSRGASPPLPPFTRNFYAEKSATELIAAFGSQLGRDFDYEKFEELVWQLGSHAADKELPALIDVLVASTNSDQQITAATAGIISRLAWEPYRKRLLDLVASPETILANSAADILMQRPETLDPATLVPGLDAQSPHTRRLFCLLLSRVPHQTDATRKALLRALQSNDDGLRWQAALAIGNAHWPERPPVDALLGCLKDTNQFVAAAAVRSLAHLGAADAAPALMAELKIRLQSPGLAPEEIRRQANAIKLDLEPSSRPVGGYQFTPRILDPDCLTLWMEPSNAQQLRRQIVSPAIPPRPGSDLERVGRDSGLPGSLIEALGSLHYQPAEVELFKLLATNYTTAAVIALQKLAPERLADQLIATAQDRQADAARREEAMVYLCYLGATNQVRNLIRLLDDTTQINHERMPPDREWRICDRAADTIAGLLGWKERFYPFFPSSRREALISRAKEWANSGTKGSQ
jgi:hypothetical protein